jgi:formylglycine-generating enzyme
MNQIPPSGFPYPFCSSSGQDSFGLWLEFTLKNIVLRMRWINPGHFSMGSPIEELHRNHYESQHEVTLQKGFWMADTACSQELWQLVMEANPSKNIGAKRPVDNVSWDDCSEFLRRVNGIIKNLSLSFPTEAQWEYACRAGTTGPFSFGINISPDQVNYNGKYPYIGEAKALNRGETVEVKSLPPNQWGLYEMHGNVWEWCYDWYVKFETDSAIDPVGPAVGKYRVLRGGSAYSGAADCRSAARSRCHSSGRYYRNGFRFVWNPWNPPEHEEKKEQQEPEDQKLDDEKEKTDKDVVMIPAKKELTARQAVLPKDENKAQRKHRK